MKKGIAAVVIGAALFMGGCSKQALTHVDDATQLKDAYVSAGFGCSQWGKLNMNSAAESSGTCSDDVSMSVYTSSDGRDADLKRIAALKKLGFKNTDVAYGDNWILRAPDSARFAEQVGVTHETL